MTTINRCCTCRYFAGQECHRYPPQTVLQPTDNQHPITYWPVSFFPHVQGDYGCGEWVAGMDPVKGEALDAGNGSLALSLVQALRLHKAWSDGEKTGPDYGGQTRDTHPDGERIWRLWWDNQLSLCDRAVSATDEALGIIEKLGGMDPRKRD